jgi:hypothetical protein
MATTLLADKLATWQKVRHGCKNMRSESDLESLLESQGQQSVHWTAVTSARTAIRAIPFGLLAAYDDHKVIDDLLPVFRFCIMSWAASNIPTYDFSHRAYLASGDMLTDRLRGNSAFFATAKSAIEAIKAAYYRREWEKEHEFGHTVIYSATECLNYARSASSSIISKYQLPQYKSGMNDEALDAAESRVSKALFDAIGADCSWLSKHSDRPKAARRLTARKLWLTEPPELWIDIWKESKRRLLENEHSENYSVWIDWYERRIRGERAAFDIPGDKRGIEDKKILRRLAEATDEDFWGKGHEYVNATLKGWLDEARERVAPPPDFDAIQSRLNAGATPQFGSQEEQNRRAELQDRIEALRLELEGLDPPLAGIGHNQPPLDLDATEIADAPAVLKEVRELTIALATELRPSRPDVPAVLEKATRLQKIGGWFAKMGNLFAEEAAKSAGKTVGPAIAVILAAQLPAIQAALGPVLQSAWSWLQSLLPLV